MKETLIVLDDFFKEPEKLRKEAKTLSYNLSQINYSNQISQKRSKYASAIFKRLAKFYGKKIIWDDDAGTYRIQKMDLVDQTKNNFFAHSDGVHDFVCLAYLSPPEECHGGTGFYLHKPTGLLGFQDFEAVNRVMRKMKIDFETLSQMIDRDGRDTSKWEPTDMVQMKYNRMIIYNGRRFHSHIFDFKKVKKGSERLSFLSYGTSP